MSVTLLDIAGIGTAAILFGLACSHNARTERPSTEFGATRIPACGHIRDIARSQIEVRFRCKSGHTAGITAMTGLTQSGHRPLSGCARTAWKRTRADGAMTFSIFCQQNEAREMALG
jgi:hypothetical protein